MPPPAGLKPEANVPETRPPTIAEAAAEISKHHLASLQNLEMQAKSAASNMAVLMKGLNSNVDQMTGLTLHELGAYNLGASRMHQEVFSGISSMNQYVEAVEHLSSDLVRVRETAASITALHDAVTELEASLFNDKK
eukprot:TRINITY_DN638_c0_g1_i1.p1 TRINITY_DN638_c0_g1~~TRINITY_DN638_c0_g1_i1.p1  ORF type:complete len:137 (+),score=28.05 TRINITY_DN638_c0_g1_i1:166-576(+)